MPNPGWLRPRSTGPHSLDAVARRAGAGPGGGATADVTGVSLDSRTVRRGDLYAALPGARAHGASFTAQAVAAGARAVLTDPAGASIIASSPDAAVRDLPTLVVPDPRAVLGGVCALVYGDLFAEDPQPMRVLGVTGTNGKTTTTYLLESALRGLGARTGLIGTVETRVGQERVPSVRTTPEAPEVHGLLAAMAEQGVTVCAMEVSSHALALHRVDGVIYDVAAFTNLSQDHLDFHQDMEGYFAAKAMLFTPERARRAVVCVDDRWGARLAREVRVPVATVRTVPPAVGALGEPEQTADWTVVERRPGPASTDFLLVGPDGARVRATCPLPGEFNVANTALALVVLVEAGWQARAAARALAGAQAVPGRMETVAGTGARGQPLCIVDYAHTPRAVAAACQALAAAARPLVVVLGAGGDRDRDKRAGMGAAAARGADVVVVTDDNPRSEDPGAIRAALLAGALAAVEEGAQAREVLEVPGRRAGVERAVDLAWGDPGGVQGASVAGGTVLVAGKGHEQGQDLGGTVTPFDDRAVLGQVLADAAARRGEPDPPGSGSASGSAAGADPAPPDRSHAAAPKETAS